MTQIAKRHWIALTVAIIGLVSGLLSILHDSWIRSAITFAITHPVLLAATIAVAALGVAGYYRVKYLKALRAYKRMAESASDLLNARFARDDIAVLQYFIECKVQNENGDCQISHKYVLKMADGFDPASYLDAYVGFDRGRMTKGEFYHSIQSHNAKVERLEEIRIEGHNIFIFRIKFNTALGPIPHEVSFSIPYKEVLPLAAKDNPIVLHIALPTKLTGCSVCLPDDWKIIRRWAEVDERKGSRRVLPDVHFSPRQDQLLEWSLQRPSKHAYYHVHFQSGRIHKQGKSIQILQSAG